MSNESHNSEADRVERATNAALGRKIGLASLIVMGSVFLSRILGQVRQSYIAYVGGAGSDVDAYTIAFQIPDLLNHIVAGGFLSVTFIPLFASHLEKKREDQGWQSFSVVITVCSLLLVILTSVAMWAAPTLVAWVAPGVVDTPETYVKAVRMTRIILPAQTFFFAGGILMAVQYAKGRFLVPALAPLIYNLGIIFGGVALSSSLGIEGFSWGVLGGAFIGQFLIQILGARKIGLRYRPSLNIRNPDFSRFVWLTLPLVLGLSMTFSMEFFFKFFGSMLGKGTVSSLNYALRVDMLLVALFGQAAGVASYPFLARLYAQGRMKQLLSTLDHTIRRYVCLVIPASALMIIAARETVVILFKRGAFSATDVTDTTLALQVFLCGAFAMAAVNLIVRGFYATRNTWLPAVFGTMAVGLSVPLYYLFMHLYGGAGVALGVAVSALLQALLLYLVWNRRHHHRGLPTYLALGRAALMTAPLAAGGWAIRLGLLRLVGGDGLFGALIVCCVLGLFFLVGSVLLARLFGVSEIEDLSRRLLNRLARRRA